ncbi:MAG: cell division topological specificity factor MinE [Desulfurobacteriaceae bacterium]
MDFWPFNKKPPSKEIAKQRLKLVLKYDRTGIPPNAVEEIKNAILDALKKFPFIEAEAISINISHDDLEKIEIEVPVKASK